MFNLDMYGTEMCRSVDVYTKYAKKYAESYKDSALEVYKEFSSFLTPGGAVLDLGCGPGRDLKRFKEDGFFPVGVDLNATFCEMAAAYSGMSVYNYDFRSTPFYSNSFDAVWGCASLVHMNTDEVREAIYEIKRVAKPGAWVYLSVKAYVNDADYSGWHRTKHGRRWFQYWGVEGFPLTLDHHGLDVSEYFVDHGFINVYAKVR